MPDLPAILAYYRATAFFAISGALPAEAETMARPERDSLIERFLTPRERIGFPNLTENDRKTRLRMGEVRFVAWEKANPDISKLLKRKAECLALQH